MTKLEDVNFKIQFCNFYRLNYFFCCREGKGIFLFFA